MGLIESFGDGSWHLVFQYVADVAGNADPRGSNNVLAAEWFDLRRMPEP